VPAGAVGSVWASGSWSALAWEALTWANVSGVLGNNNPDMNTRIYVYLKALYSAPDGSDLTTMVIRYLNSQTGEFTARFQKLMTDATA
jgi:hypothetical protein